MACIVLPLATYQALMLSLCLPPQTSHLPRPQSPTRKRLTPPGFYTLDPTPPSNPSQTPQLILAPFQGQVACQTILFGRGVCGTAAQTQTTQLVHDVRLFPGHIACDARSLSEIVVPIVVDGRTVAIIDVDCAVVGGFDGVDRKWLERLGGLLGAGCDWP